MEQNRFRNPKYFPNAKAILHLVFLATLTAFQNSLLGDVSLGLHIMEAN